MKTITVYPDQSKSYFHASEALEDLGFVDEGTREGEYNPINGIKKYKTFRNKRGGLYAFYGMSNFNTTIYEITLLYIGDRRLR